MIFRTVPDSLLHFADPTIPGLSGRDLIGRREHDDDWGSPEPSTMVRRATSARPRHDGQVIPLTPHRRPAA